MQYKTDTAVLRYNCPSPAGTDDLLLLHGFAAADIYRPPNAFYDVLVGNLRTGA